MDYKKAYKEALERAKLSRLQLLDIGEEAPEIEYIFPELKESEDEKIRKEMIEVLEKEAKEFPSSVIASKANSWIAWLEKQGDYYHLVNFDEAEKEKDDFTTRKFLCCNTSFGGFEKNEHYWLEYIGDDRYVGRSDNIFGMKFHITPKQLFSFFDEIPNESNELNESQPEETEKTIKSSLPTIENPSNNQIIDALIHELKEQDGILTAICGIKTKTIITWLEKQGSIGNTNEKLRQYREYLIKETERWHKMEEDETLSKIGRQDCIGHANAYISARSKFEDLFNYDSWTKKQGDKDKLIQELGEYKVKYTQEVLSQQLENQGEHITNDKIEPKFKVGDWVVQGSNILQIQCVGDKYYCYETVGGYVGDMLVSELDSLYHLWTIQDAKDGDVLYCNKRVLDNNEIIMMYSGINERHNIDSYCRYNPKLGFQTYITNVLNAEEDFITPATKEQCDTLFRKMKEAGLSFDADKKVFNWNVSHENIFPSSPVDTTILS